MSGIFGSRTIKGNRITEFSETSATVGTVIPFGYGRFTSGGNVIWAPLPPKEHRNVVRQGKGGVKQEQFSYTLSYAIAFAKGPIAGYWWIKRNGKVVYTQDPAAPIEDQEYAAKWLERATLYFGTMGQLPDSTIESYEGSGQISAFHHLAYIVVEDDDVTDGGGAVPTYEACVIADGLSYGTSPPYPVELVDEVGHRPEMIGGKTIPSLKPVDEVQFASALLGGTLRQLRKEFTADPEGVEFQTAALGGEVRQIRKFFTAEPDEVQFQSIILGGNVYRTLIEYDSEPDAVQFQTTILGGTIS